LVTLTQIYDGKFQYTADNIKDISHIQKACSHVFPDAEYSPKHISNGGKWDGIIRFYNKATRTIPVGFEPLVREYLDSVGTPYSFKRMKPFATYLPFSDTIRPYQKAAIKRFFIRKHGIIQVPTRGGKTFIAAECIRHITHESDIQVLFFVDTGDLFEQAIGDMHKHLKIPKSKIGTIRGDKFDPKQITVCMVQTVQSMLKQVKDFSKLTREKIIAKRNRRNAMLALLHKVGFYVIDECHEYSSTPRIELIERMKNAQFRLFISASPFKSESELDNLNLRQVSGEVIYIIPENDLKEQGYLAQDSVLLLTVDHENNRNVQLTETDTYNDHIKRILTHNKHRNYVLVNTLEICRKLGLKTLVLFARKEHGYFIKTITDDEFISGDMEVKDRSRIKTSFLKKKGGVLLASDVFKKGITLPEVEVMVNAGGGLEKSLILQKKGRVLGVKGKKIKAMYIDIMDLYRHFSAHSQSRFEVYEESLPLERITVLDSDDIDFYTDIRTALKDWFEL